MKTFTKLTGLTVAVLMATSIGSVYAEEGDVTKLRTQDRVRTEFNMQTPDSDYGQIRNREERTVMNKNQNQYQYQHQYMKNFQNGDADSAGTSTRNKNATANTWQGNSDVGSMNRVNTTNRYMQGSSMGRQSSAGGSMGGGRR